MMKRLLLVLLVLLVSSVSAFALTVEEAVVTTRISDREPIDKVESYPAQTGKLYCFTRIQGAAEETSIDHVWLYQGKEMARVTLPIRSANWRTYSSKNIVSEWQGEWQVQIVDASGTELARVPFRVE